MAARYPPEEEEVPANLLQESEIKRHASKQVYDPSGAVSVITRNLTAGSATPLLVKFPTLINVQQYDGMGENRNNEGVFLIPRSPGKCGMIGDLAHARNDTLAQRLAVNCRYTILQAALKTIDKGMVFVIGKYVGDPTYLYARSETIQDAGNSYFFAKQIILIILFLFLHLALLS